MFRSLRHTSATEARELPRDVNLGNTLLTPCDWLWCLVTRYAFNMSRKANAKCQRSQQFGTLEEPNADEYPVTVTMQGLAAETVLKLLLRRLGT